jgi:prepilin-type N-terminal cleavage/methylation domain-containing protein
MDYMTKNRNKGFSLIEVIIGVAVLTILLTPVVKQLAQTMKTNRLAKEQQYVNENATSLMEYTQKTSFTDLETTGSSADGDTYLTEPVTKFSKDCQIYIYDATTNSVSPISSYTLGGADVTVSYTTRVYKMNNVLLGSRRAEYTRTVLLDDLANKISSLTFTDETGATKGLSVLYNVGSLDDLTLSDGDLQLTSEGSIVKYGTENIGSADTPDNVDYISAIVCEKKDSNAVVEDANETLLGSMHDLKSTQMALVNGAVSDYDGTARDSLHTEMLDVIKTKAPLIYDQIQENETLNLDAYLSSFYKSIYIKINQNESEKYYQISVDVTYDASFTIDGNSYKADTMEYNVFAQKYNYDGTTPKVPSVYIEYQPFLVDEVGYASSEYIYVENYVDGASIYLYKPTKDYVYVSGQYTGYDSSKTYDSEEDELYDLYDTDGSTAKKYTQTGYTTAPVDIYINRVVANGKTAGKTVNLYTNLDVTKSETTEGKYGQFILNGTVDSTGKFENFSVTQDKKATASGSESLIRVLSVNDDKDTTDRLYTATVIVSPVADGVNTVTITGAKGGN